MGESITHSDPRLAGSLRSGLAAYGACMLRWTPVWVPLLVTLQFAGRGLVPAWQEKERLDREEALLDARMAGLHADRAAIARDWERLEDPVWRERVRRSVFDPDRTTLTLAEAER